MLLAYNETPRQVTPLMVIDHYALLYMALILAAGLATAILSFGYMKDLAINREEYYLLLLLAILGAMIIVCSSHLASFFLGLEILSISLYALIAYPKGSLRHVEAGMKYLVLAATSSAFMLFGMALVYAESGSLSLAVITSKAALASQHSLPMSAGFVLILVGIGFKLALVPFHMWTPDVYEGAPAPVTAFIATVSKGALFALLLRYFGRLDFNDMPSLFSALCFLAFASMIIGNLLALFQANVKRILAYSSIAHMGYLLTAFLAGGILAAQAVTFYLFAYFITIFGAFGIIILLSDPSREAEDLSYYKGMAWRRPMLASVFIVMLFSLAGIPLTAGFIGKFYLISAGASADLWLLIVTLALSSVIGLFYYLRIILALFSREEGFESAHVKMIPVTGRAILAALTLLLVLIGVYPGPLLDGIRIMLEKLV
jgi:NADH-quinone oxidoreductase subunit N